MTGTDIVVTTGGGQTFGGYLARPEATPAAGILVLQEIFGVNQVMRAIADGLAEKGTFALVPDLFWRQEPGIQLTDQSEAEWQRAFELYQGFDETAGIDDARAALGHLRAVEGCNGRAGAIGYCLGGKLAYLMATRSDVDCAVGYYGVGIDDALDEAVRIPLLLHVAEKDSFVPPEAQAKVAAALDPNSLVTRHTYPGMDHAFARVGGEHYDHAAAALADQRSADFLARHLA